MPAPRHGGRVQIVGNYALETVAARSGGVALFWMGRDGHPIPPAQVALPSVNIDIGGRTQTVPARAVGDAYVASIAIPPAANVSVTVPLVVVSGVVYQQVVVPSVVVVVALPEIIVMPVAPVGFGWRGGGGWHGKHRKFRGGFGFGHGWR